VLRAVGSALLVAVACAAGWAVLARETSSGAPWVIAAAGAAVGGTARLAADRRGLRVQAAAVGAFLVFLVLGEGLLYRTALEPRLEAMHAAEGAEDPAGLADRELDATDVLQYLQSIEIGIGWLVAVGAGIWLAARIPRLPPAVAAFSPPAAAAPAAPPGIDVDVPQEPAVASADEEPVP